MSVVIDPKWFRQVLGQYASAVAVITAQDGDGQPVGIAVSSFTSASLDPPLVAFYPDKRSTSWPRIRESGSFCVNILSQDQEAICRSFASQGGDKFGGIAWHAGASGAPILDGVTAWIDCGIEAVYEAGDHFVVLGRVLELDIAGGDLPLLFFRGGYGRFVPQSLAVVDAGKTQLRLVDLARPHMESVARELDVECLAVTLSHGELVLLASAGQPQGPALPARVDQRAPHVPPLGATFVVWSGESVLDEWLSRLDAPQDSAVYAACCAHVERARADGYVVLFGSDARARLDEHLTELAIYENLPWEALAATPHAYRSTDLQRIVDDVRTSQPLDLDGSGSYDVASISVPIFDVAGKVNFGLTIVGLPSPITGSEIAKLARCLADAAGRVTIASGGRDPRELAAV